MSRRPVRWPLATIVLVVSLAGTASAQPIDMSIDAPPGLAAPAARVRGMNLEGLRRSLAASDLPVPERISIALVPDADPRAAGLPPWVVGLARGTSAIVILPDRIGSYPYDSLEAVVRHEIVHLALTSRAGGRPLPRWFHEGVATALESGWDARDELRLLVAALDPPSLADIRRLFASDAQPDTSQAYRLSAALVDDIRQRHGPRVVGEIASRVAAGAAFDTAFQTATGDTVETAAARAWAAHRRISRWFLIVTAPSAVWTFILLLAGIAFLFQIRRRRMQRRQWEEDEGRDEDEADKDKG
jgi:hypothetical protein